MRPLLAIISSLHSLGIVHRDIKPENIFINTAGQIQLGDFGLAVCKHYDRMTERVGTLDYMAPEVREGDQCFSKPISINSLVEALGGSLLAMPTSETLQLGPVRG
jgi:serine/threonine protein kinase